MCELVERALLRMDGQDIDEVHTCAAVSYGRAFWLTPSHCE